MIAVHVNRVYCTPYGVYQIFLGVRRAETESHLSELVGFSQILSNAPMRLSPETSQKIIFQF